MFKIVLIITECYKIHANQIALLAYEGESEHQIGQFFT